MLLYSLSHHSDQQTGVLQSGKVKKKKVFKETQGMLENIGEVFMELTSIYSSLLVIMNTFSDFCNSSWLNVYINSYQLLAGIT